MDSLKCYRKHSEMKHLSEALIADPHFSVFYDIVSIFGSHFQHPNTAFIVKKWNFGMLWKLPLQRIACSQLLKKHCLSGQVIRLSYNVVSIMTQRKYFFLISYIGNATKGFFTSYLKGVLIYNIKENFV